MELDKEQKPANGRWNKKIAGWSRWLHLYLSMISFAILFFFAITGLTLNHTEWFSNQQKSNTIKGKLDDSWVNDVDTLKIEKLKVVEFLRSKHNIKGALSDFIIDESQCTVAFSGPGYSADVFIDRQKGDYDITESFSGFVGLINDLHKGRDSGKAWSFVIDISAILMVLVSFTGMIMIFYLKKKRIAGILVAIIGLILFYLIYLSLVP
jgi:uncharacterized protein